MNSKTKRIVAAVSILAASGIATVHAAATFLHIAPRNPISIPNHSAITSYIEPFFHQNWRLFAPNPVETDEGVLARVKLQDAAGNERVTEFLDLTTPNLERTLHHPFPDRLPRVLSHLRRTYLDNVETIKAADDEKPAESSKDDPLVEPTEDELAKATPEQRRSFELTKALLTSIVMKSAVNRWDGKITAVQIRFVQHTFPRFSQRHNPGVGDVTHWTLSWWPVPNDKSRLEKI